MIDIIPYSEETKEYIKTLNYEWLEKYFRVEPNDIVQLSDPTAEIIEKEGLIFYARYDGSIVGTASLLKIDSETFELGKMAVSESFQGLGVGKALLEHCLSLARDLNIKKLILHSNTKLQSAIYLYRKYGFYETKLGPGHYERANIKMEFLLSE